MSGFKKWLLHGYSPEPEGAYEGEHPEKHGHHQHAWWMVMCLTGVDYFSTLGYQPGIAALAAGALSPVATLVLILLTLFGAFPIYRRVAEESPHGEGSISMLESLLTWWKGKLFVLALLGFVATDFVITITLSAADAAAHIVENPLVKTHFETNPILWQILLTMGLIVLLGGVFLKGFKEAIGIAVGLVIAYLGLNVVVIGRALAAVAAGWPQYSAHWQADLAERWTFFTHEKWHLVGGLAAHPSPIAILIALIVVFPELALGLSGFETGVAVMTLVKGRKGDTEANPVGRIANTRRLLLVAGVIMSLFLLTSSTATTLLITPEQFAPADPKLGIAAGQANGRALAFLAHKYLGDGFGTAYDIVTVLILWFAGASAMAGLLNIVPRYLPRYGMAPEWTRANRPLVFIFTSMSLVVTAIFKANVDAQAGAYATGVLVLMTSAAVAVTIASRSKGQKLASWAYGLITVVFAYTLIQNVHTRPDGVKIAGVFIFGILAVSLTSRVWRTTELRVSEVVVDPTAERMIAELARGTEIRFIANHPDKVDAAEYAAAERAAAWAHHFQQEARTAFLEVYVHDASNFASTLVVEGVDVDGFWVLRCHGVAVPNAIAALLLEVQKRTGRRPHVYFNWIEASPLLFLAKFFLSGQGDIAPIAHEILRRAEPDPNKRPVVHAAG